MSATKIEHPSIDERRAKGKKARELTAISAPAGWKPDESRADPVALLEEQNATREPDLVPVRHGRMLVSPFTFYRGAAKIMAADLEHTPRAGLKVQLCGDAHLSNFGVFASPERQLLFDLNDFDETLPGPFEYDLKRLSASFTIAARNNGFSKADAREATLASVSAYREAMAEFAEMTTMEVWYAHLSEATLMAAIESFVGASKGTSEKTKTEEEGGQEGEEGGRGRGEGGEEGRPEGPHARQPAGAVEARRARRRPLSDRQPAAPRHPDARSGRDVRHFRRAVPACDARAVSRLPGDVAGRPSAPAREVPDRRYGAQGRRRRQCRRARVHRLAPGTRRERSTVPPGQGGNGLGARGSPAEEPLQAARRAGRATDSG